MKIRFVYYPSIAKKINIGILVNDMGSHIEYFQEKKLVFNTSYSNIWGNYHDEQLRGGFKQIETYNPKDFLIYED